MSRQFFKVYLITCFAVLASCTIDDSTNPTGSSTNGNQTVFVECTYQTSYTDSNGAVQNIPNVKIEGKLYSEKYPQTITCKANGIIKKRLSYQNGFTKFGDLSNYKIIPVTDNLEEIDLEITTEFGTVAGKVKLPDIPGPLQVSTTDTLPLNTPFTVSWVNSNADWYRFYLKQRYKIGDYMWNTLIKDTVLTSNTITLPGSFFNRSGEITDICIYSYNGAIPALCQTANLTGDGQGYAIYTTFTRDYTGDKIIIGNGWSK